jgi:quercetin dioxygenase-like cupin family protein
VAPEQARVYSQGLGEAHILVGAKQSGGAWWMGQFREDPGFMTLLHLHPQMDEYFLVLQGVLSVYIDMTWQDLKAGTFARVPRGIRMRKATPERSQCTLLGRAVQRASSGFIELNEIAKRVPPGPQFGAEIAKIMPNHGTTPLGPPPQRG